MLTHIADQPHMQTGDGPIALILTPTRELAEQIYRHAKKFGKVFNIRACAVFGGEGNCDIKSGVTLLHQTRLGTYITPCAKNTIHVCI